MFQANLSSLIPLSQSSHSLQGLNSNFPSANDSFCVQTMEMIQKINIGDQPKMNYEVCSSDTLERIAAAHDCTVGQLVKLNKMHSRMVFAGQKILIPVPIEPSTSNEEPTANDSKQIKWVVSANDTKNDNTSHSVRPTPTVPLRQATAETNLPVRDSVRKGPGGAIPLQIANNSISKVKNPLRLNLEHSNSASTAAVSRIHQSALVKTQSVPVGGSSIDSQRSSVDNARMSGEIDLEDRDCLQRFLKIKVKQVTESDGTITGTLLVTPNCLMFDPEVSHPLVKENGSDLYGMVANMEDIISVTVYKQFGDLTGERRNKKEDIFDPHNITGKTPAARMSLDNTSVSSALAAPIECPTSDVKFIGGADSDNEPTYYGTSAGGLLADDLYERAQSMQQQHPDSLGVVHASSASLSGSEQQLPCIEEEEKNTPSRSDNPPLQADQKKEIMMKPRASSDLTMTDKPSIDDLLARTDFIENCIENKNLRNTRVNTKNSLPDRPRAHSDLEPSSSLDSASVEPLSAIRRSQSPSSPFSRYSPNMARKSFGKLSRTLSARASSFKGQVASGAQTVASGTQKVAHGVVTHTRSAADHIQTGIQTSAKVVASVPGSLANVTDSIVNVGSGLVDKGQSGVMEVYNDLLSSLGEESQERSPMAMKREKSLATLESLCQKTQQAREQSSAANKDLFFTNVMGQEEFCQSLVTTPTDPNNGSIIGTPPDPPFYMTVRVDRRKKRKRVVNNGGSSTYTDRSSISSYAGFDDDQCAFGNKRKREFWFAVPQKRVDAIYHFLLHWSPEKYGQEQASTAEETKILLDNSTSSETTATSTATNNFEASGHNSTNSTANKYSTNKNQAYNSNRGFVVLDADADDSLTGDKPSSQPPFGQGADLNREWEIVTVRELCRRLSLEDSFEPSEMPLPEGSQTSQVFDEFMIRQIVDILPPRAEGYPWVKIYSSEKHGFSLATLYRKMSEWTEEMSPVLLVVRDVNGHVFGAVASTALRPNEHYYGTGDSCILYRFTGEFPHTRELRSYTWTGDNQFFINATKEFLSMGAGGGHYGLWLDADLNHGRSQKCATFDNEPLAGGTNEDFVVQFVEAYGFSMS